MRYVLDVNALVALGIFHHQFHERVNAWITSQEDARWLTCSITELGFARVIAQTPNYNMMWNRCIWISGLLKTNRDHESESVRSLTFTCGSLMFRSLRGSGLLVAA